jgi:hypothetical protein
VVEPCSRQRLERNQAPVARRVALERRLDAARPYPGLSKEACLVPRRSHHGRCCRRRRRFVARDGQQVRRCQPRCCEPADVCIRTRGPEREWRRYSRLCLPRKHGKRSPRRSRSLLPTCVGAFRHWPSHHHHGRREAHKRPIRTSDQRPREPCMQQEASGVGVDTFIIIYGRARASNTVRFVGDRIG